MDAQNIFILHILCTYVCIIFDGILGIFRAIFDLSKKIALSILLLKLGVSVKKSKFMKKKSKSLKKCGKNDMI